MVFPLWQCLAQNLSLSPTRLLTNLTVFTDQGGCLALKTSQQAEYPTDGAQSKLLRVLNLDHRLGVDNARSKIIMGADADVQGSARECT